MRWPACSRRWRSTRAPIAASSTPCTGDANIHGRRPADRPQEVEEPVDDRSRTRRSKIPPSTRTSSPFTTYLAKCLDKKVVFYQVQNNAAEIEAMRSGRLHVGGFDRPHGVRGEPAGAIPFAVKGTEKEFQGYNLIVIVEGEPPTRSSPTSGQEGGAHVAVVQLGPPGAARAVPGRGTWPDKDHKPVFSASTTSRSSAWAPTTTRARSRPTCSTAWRCAGRSRNPTTASSTQPEVPDVVVRVRARPRSQARDKMLSCFYDYRFPARDGEGLRRRRPLLPGSTTRRRGSGAQVAKGRPGASTRRATTRKPSARRKGRSEGAKKQP